MKRLLIIIAGGTASGKSTLTEEILQTIGPEDCTVVSQDWYYHDHPDLSPSQLEGLNYDHPDAFENVLLIAHVKMLLEGEVVFAPKYDFTTHRRRPEWRCVAPTHVIIVEGILALTINDLLPLASLKVFVETPDDERFIRRLVRDTKERGRLIDHVICQWQKTVQPMYLEFCFPSRRLADIIVPHGGRNPKVLQMVRGYLADCMKNGTN